MSKTVKHKSGRRGAKRIKRNSSYSGTKRSPAYSAAPSGLAVLATFGALAAVIYAMYNQEHEDIERFAKTVDRITPAPLDKK